MSEKEYKDKCEMMFKKNTILLNENEELKAKSIIPYREKGYIFDEDLHEIYFLANGELMIKASVVEELKAKIENLKKTYRKQRNKRIDELQKKNAELKKDKEWLDNTNNEQTKVILELQAQIDQLSNDNHVLKTAFITQNEQIEKMKCCGNCKYSQYISCPNTRKCSGHSKWELPE